MGEAIEEEDEVAASEVDLGALGQCIEDDGPPELAEAEKEAYVRDSRQRSYARLQEGGAFGGTKVTNAGYCGGMRLAWEDPYGMKGYVGKISEMQWRVSWGEAEGRLKASGVRSINSQGSQGLLRPQCHGGGAVVDPRKVLSSRFVLTCKGWETLETAELKGRRLEVTALSNLGADGELVGAQPPDLHRGGWYTMKVHVIVVQMLDQLRRPVPTLRHEPRFGPTHSSGIWCPSRHPARSRLLSSSPCSSRRPWLGRWEDTNCSPCPCTCSYVHLALKDLHCRPPKSAPLEGKFRPRSGVCHPPAKWARGARADKHSTAPPCSPR